MTQTPFHSLHHADILSVLASLDLNDYVQLKHFLSFFFAGDVSWSLAVGCVGTQVYIEDAGDIACIPVKCELRDIGTDGVDGVRDIATGGVDGMADGDSSLVMPVSWELFLRFPVLCALLPGDNCGGLDTTGLLRACMPTPVAPELSIGAAVPRVGVFRTFGGLCIPK